MKGRSYVKLRQKMEQIRKTYHQRTGQELMNSMPIGRDTAKNMAQVVSRLYGGKFTSDLDLKVMRFYTATKVESAKYSVKIIDIHKEGDNQYNGLEIETTELPTEMQAHIEKLKVGESLTFYHEAHDMDEITDMTRKDLPVVSDDRAINHPEEVTPRQLITEDLLYSDSLIFRPQGNEDGGYVVGLRVLNKQGLHMRPGSLIVKVASKPEYADCEIYLKRKDVVKSAKSIMGIMLLESTCNSQLIGEAKGPNAKPCLEEIAKLFQTKFGEL